MTNQHSRNRASPAIIATMRLYRGAPTIFINDHPIHGGFVGTRGGSHFLAAKPEGVLLMDYNGTSYGYYPIGPGGQVDTAKTEADLSDVFSRNPQALGIVALGMRPSQDWVRANLGEMPVAGWPIDWLKSKRPDPSWASEVWRRDTVAAVKTIAGRLHKAFNGRVILYQIGAGGCGENCPQICFDSSPIMLRYLRAWLRERYKNDVKQLRRFWSDPRVTFETASPPDRNEQLATEWFAFRSPFRRRTADYLEAHALCVEKNILLWAEAVKQATHGEALAGSPAAAMLDIGLHTDIYEQMAKNTVAGYLASPHLDLVQSPASYCYRDLGRGDTTFMQPTGSVQLAGKMHLRDLDTRTSPAAWKEELYSRCRLFKTPTNVWEDAQILVRDTAYSIMKSGIFYWHEIGGDNMYSLPEHIRTARRLLAVGRGAVHADRRMAERGLAVFVHPESNFLQANANRLMFAMNYEARQFHWAHSGMASNIFCLGDAAHPAMPPPKVIMVTNAFTMTDKQASAVIALAKKNHATIVWLMAPGVQTDKGFDLDHVRRITGFKIRALNAEALPRILLAPGKHPWSRVTWNENGPHVPEASFGAGPFNYDDSGARSTGPIFYADVDRDPGATVLGELVCVKKPGLVMRRRDGYTSVYCAAPYLHRALLRRIGKDSGAHVYLDADDLVHASRELLLVNALWAGTKEFHWPQTAQVVVDLFSGRTVAENTKHWTTELKRHETRFYFAGSSKVAEKVLRGMKLKWQQAIGY